MITGVMVGRVALVRLVVRAPSGIQTDVEFVLDTGFAGYLALPATNVVALGVPFLHMARSRLADASRALLPVHDAVVVWAAADRLIEVVVTRGLPLLGMCLLDGHDVHLEVTDGGLVCIEPL